MKKDRIPFKKNWLLVAILFLAFVLRFWKLNSYPAFNADEAAIGYNAHSLILTGKDEHGNSWPIHFQSFNDYKPGLYFYLILPFVKILGLNEWAVRIPSAFLGVLTVFLIYLLTKEFFKGKKLLGKISAFFLAISPWHIHFSRGGWEVNVGTFFITLGIYFFVKAVNFGDPLKKDINKYFYLSLISFAVSLYTYHSARIISPLIGLALFIFYWPEVRKNLKFFLAAVLVAFIFLLPLGRDIFKPSVVSRAAGVGLFADPGPLSKVNEQRGEHSNFLSLIPRIFHNKAVNYGLAFLANWAAHYHGEFLFLSGDSIQRDKVPEMGEMYLFDILFVFLGLLFLVKNFSRSSKLIFGWLIIAPLASALTFQSPHALRAHNLVIPLVIISALGFYSLVNWLKNFISNRKLLNFVYGFIALILTWNFLRYLHLYWVHMAKEYPYSSQYGVKELVDYVKNNEKKYRNIVVTNRYDQPYILFLFYLKYSPVDFQKEHILTARDRYGFSTVKEFGKYRFIEFGKWEEVREIYQNSLIVGTPLEIPQEANIIKKIFGTNGFEYFDLVAN